MPTLSGVSATSLITLFARAEESRLPDSLLHDRFAAAAIEKIVDDFSRLKLSRDGIISLAIRAKVLDDWTRAFLQYHPQATVVHLGCGLDSRFYRVAPPDSVRWFNVDLPEVIAMRRLVYPWNAGDTLIETSVTSEKWLTQLPNTAPVLIVTEGLLPYLAEADVRQLVQRLLEHFSTGELIFDGYRRLGIWTLNRHRSIRATGARLQWSIRDARELERWNDRLQLVTEQTRHDPGQIARLSFPLRWMNRIPALRGIARLLRYRFDVERVAHT